MKSWALAGMMVSLLALAACKSSSSNAGGGGGGGGGEGGGTSGTNATTSASGTNSSSSTSSNMTTSTGSNPTSSSTTASGSPTSSTATASTGGSSCDNTGVCQDMDQDTTNDCVSCAFAGPCADQLSACANEPDCCTPQADGSCGTDSYIGCLNACGQGDTACQDACTSSFPTGAGLYQALAVCAVCDTCPVDCPNPNCP